MAVDTIDDVVAPEASQDTVFQGTWEDLQKYDVIYTRNETRIRAPPKPYSGYRNKTDLEHFFWLANSQFTWRETSGAYGTRQRETHLVTMNPEPLTKDQRQLLITMSHEQGHQDPNTSEHQNTVNHNPGEYLIPAKGPYDKFTVYLN